MSEIPNLAFCILPTTLCVKYLLSVLCYCIDRANNVLQVKPLEQRHSVRFMRPDNSSVHPSIHPPINLSTSPLTLPTSHSSVHPSTHINLPHLTTHLSIHSSFYPNIHPSIHPSTSPVTFPFTNLPLWFLTRGNFAPRE